MHLDAVEHRDTIVFLHSVEEGPASQSYGIQVAQLAGIPSGVIRTARKRLADLEAQAASTNPQADLFNAPASAEEPSPEPQHPALEALRAADPDTLSPRDALELIYQLRRLLE